MSKELDTSWFDLKNYDKVNELDLFGWSDQLYKRGYIHIVTETTRTRLLKEIKENPIFDSHNNNQVSNRRYPFNTVSVKSTPAHYAWMNGNDERLIDVWLYCELENIGNATEEQKELINKPLDLLFMERGAESSFSNIYIDLSATDEQIMGDFRHWLTEYRKATGYKSHKRKFTANDLSEWVEYRVLPYIDLMLVAKLEGRTITQANAARLIFPDEYDVDITDRLRRTTKPKAEWLLKDSTIAMIDLQANSSA